MPCPLLRSSCCCTPVPRMPPLPTPHRIQTPELCLPMCACAPQTSSGSGSKLFYVHLCSSTAAIAAVVQSLYQTPEPLSFHKNLHCRSQLCGWFTGIWTSCTSIAIIVRHPQAEPWVKGSPWPWCPPGNKKRSGGFRSLGHQRPTLATSAIIANADLSWWRSISLLCNHCQCWSQLMESISLLWIWSTVSHPAGTSVSASRWRFSPPKPDSYMFWRRQLFQQTCKSLRNYFLVTDPKETFMNFHRKNSK
jgi:hypothetical protein